MISRWWREWRARRSVFAEVADLDRRDEAAAMDSNLNPINLAKTAVDRGDNDAAAAHWEHARLLMPNAVITSPDSLDILLGLGRHDEADALMREGGKRFPRDPAYLIGLARSAEHKGDHEEALKRWSVVRDRARDSVLGFHGCARCLMALRRYDEAEAQWNGAIHRLGKDPGASMGRAVISDYREDWAESEARWKYVAETFDFTPGYAFRARALMHLGRLDEAESYLQQPSLTWPGDLEIAIRRSHLAERRGDLAAACERWAAVRAIRPDHRAGYEEGARCLFEFGQYDEADVVLRSAVARFPRQEWPMIRFARLAHDRGDWPAAAERWAAVRDQFPEESSGYSFGAAALRAAGRHDEAAALNHER